MENKSFFRALFWALLVFLMWNMVVAPQIWPPPPRPQPGQEQTTTAPAGGTSADNTPTDGAAAGSISGDRSTAEVGSAPAVTTPGSPATQQTGQSIYTATGEGSQTFLDIGDTSGGKDSPFRCGIKLSNVGASIDTIELSDHKKSVTDDSPYRLLTPVENANNPGAEPWRSLTIGQITIDGVPVRLDALPWKASSRKDDDVHVAEFSATILRGTEPVIELVRRFTLARQTAASLRHDLDVALTLRNLSDQPRDVVVTEFGPVGLNKEGRFTPDRKVYVATVDEFFSLETKTVEDIAKQKPPPLFDRQRGGQFLWLAAANLYFTCTTCPVDADKAEDSRYVIEATAIDLDQNAGTDRDVTTRLTQRIALAPHDSKTLRGAVYVGPKDREAFIAPANADYVKRNYLEQIKEGYGSCTFNFLTDIMIRLLNWLEGIVGNFGVAIIILVIIVRAILHPVTKKTQVNMVKMQQNMATLQPKIEEVKKKYANDKTRLQQEMMKVYKEEGVNPFGQMATCLPMALQMPIWIALYSSLSNNVAMRGRGFCLWITDLTAPDNLFTFDPPINLPLLGELNGFHLLPLLVGGFMFAQQKLMPKPKQAEAKPSSPQADQAAQMQKMMPYMSLVMIFLFYKFPSGLNLYIMTSSIFGTLEQVYIRKHIKKNDLGGPPQPVGKEPPKPRPAGFFAKLQKQVEDAQKLKSHRKKGGK